MKPFFILPTSSRLIKRVAIRSRRRRQFVFVWIAAFIFPLTNEQRVYYPSRLDTSLAQNVPQRLSLSPPTLSGGYGFPRQRALFYNVSWIIDDALGQIAAFDSNGRAPLWSDDGIVFQLSGKTKTRYNQTNNCQTLTNPNNRASAAFGRVYFLLTNETSTFENDSKTFKPLNLLVALDPNAQGRIVWIRKAGEFERFFSSTNDATRCEFSSPPSPTENDFVKIEVARGDARRFFLLNSANGKILPF